MRGEATFEKLLTRGLNMGSDSPVQHFEKHFGGPSLSQEWGTTILLFNNDILFVIMCRCSSQIHPRRPPADF
jgi:hypothetical protein